MSSSASTTLDFPAPDSPVTMVISILFSPIKSADESDLRFERYAGLSLDARLDVLDKAENIGRGSAAAVDYESRVLLADLRAADADTLESALFNECARKMTLGALECAARAGIFKRLLIPAAGNDIVHGIFICSGSPGVKRTEAAVMTRPLSSYALWR